MKKFWIVFFSLFSAIAIAQNTATLTGTATDTGGTVWNNASWTAVLNNVSGIIPKYVDGTSVQNNVRGVLNNTATFSGSLGINARIVPANSSWKITICPMASVACVVLPQPIVVSETSFNIGNAVSAQLLPISLSPNPGIYSYNTGEILPGGKEPVPAQPTPGQVLYTAGNDTVSFWSPISGSWRIFSGSAISEGTQNHITQYLPGGASIGNSGVTVDAATGNNLYVPNLKTYLPRIDITNANVGTACANPADPSNTNDSTCVIQAAVTLACSGPVTSGQGTEVYIPTGNYKVAGTITIPCGLSFASDCPKCASLTQPSSTTNPMLVVDTTATVNIHDITLQGTDNTSTGTLLTFVDGVADHVYDTIFNNSGARGLIIVGTERFVCFRCDFEYVRYPIDEVGNTNENHFYSTLVDNPGETLNGYCFSTLNCTAGVYHTANTGTPTTITYPIYATLPVKGGFVLFDGTNVEQAQFDFTAGSTAPTWNTTVGGFTSDGTNTNAWKNLGPTPTPIYPEPAISVHLSGVKNVWQNSSIKPLYYRSGMVLCGESCVAEGSYFETNTSSDNTAVMTTDPGVHYVFTATSTSSSVPLTSVAEIPSYVDNPAYITLNLVPDKYYIFPCDYSQGSSTQSACAPTGVTQGMYEIAQGAAAGDGDFHFTARNIGGTAPAGTQWSAASYMIRYDGSYSPGTIRENHIDVTTPLNLPTGYFAACNDANTHPCADVLIGRYPDDVVIQSLQHTNSLTTLLEDSAALSIQGMNGVYTEGGLEWQGGGFIKIPLYGTLNSDSTAWNNIASQPFNSMYSGFSLPNESGILAFGTYGTATSFASFFSPGFNFSTQNNLQEALTLNQLNASYSFMHTFQTRTCITDQTSTTLNIADCWTPAAHTLYGANSTTSFTTGTALISDTINNVGTGSVSVSERVNGDITPTTLNGVAIGSYVHTAVPVKYSASITPTAIPASSCQVQTFSGFTGIASGSLVFGLSTPGSLAPHMWIGNYSSAGANSVQIEFCGDATSGTPPSGTYYVASF
jgi:hypothetical protein